MFTRNAALVFLVVAITLLAPVRAEVQQETVRQVLTRELQEEGWRLIWSAPKDFIATPEQLAIVDQKIALGAKVRHLTAALERDNEFEVWACYDYHVVFVAPIGELWMYTLQCERLNTPIDY